VLFQVSYFIKVIVPKRFGSGGDDICLIKHKSQSSIRPSIYISSIALNDNGCETR